MKQNTTVRFCNQPAGNIFLPNVFFFLEIQFTYNVLCLSLCFNLVWNFLFQDRNDIPPVFLNASPTINLDDNVEIGTKVGSLQATDSDATAPGNKVSI